MNYQFLNDDIIIEISHELNNYSIQQFFEHYHLGKKSIHELRMSKRVSLNGKPIFQNFNQLLKTNDFIQFPIFTDEEIDFIPQDLPLHIIYEDELLLIVNKQAFMDVHPDSKDGLNTIVNAVAYHYQMTNQKRRVRYIHRLDRDTTGLLVFVKSYFVHNLYDYLLEKKDIKRYYYAICTNSPKKTIGVIDAPIGKDRHHPSKRIISKTGQKAITSYKLVEKRQSYTLLELELFTGRTHQIRVHLASIQCPIVGDPLYGTHTSKIKRQALHAYKLTLLHPITLKPIFFEIPLPVDMLRIWKD